MDTVKLKLACSATYEKKTVFVLTFMVTKRSRIKIDLSVKLDLFICIIFNFFNLIFISFVTWTELEYMYND